MNDTTLVYLITGFLGSGKTTFLNRIIDRFPKDKKMAILMNEFGEIGIDGTLVEGDDINLLEISRGSIFCVCVKTDFIKGLFELGNQVKPDVLLIESTGVANPSDLKRDIKLPIFNNRYQFKEQFCMIDCAHFLDAYDVYASLEKQIASSSVFILNKIDISHPEDLVKIKQIISEFHPQPNFYETSYADIPFENFFPQDHFQVKTEKDSPVKPAQVMTESQLDDYIDTLLSSSDLEITPPDQLVSVTYRWLGNRIDEVKSFASRLPSSVLRAKGFIEYEGAVYILNYVMGDWTIERSAVPKERIPYMNVIVLIGPPQSMEGIAQASLDGVWSNLGVFQPMTGKTN